MFFKAVFRSVGMGCLMLCASHVPGAAERIDRGNQVIDGTAVNTVIYHERGYAVFSNDCGSQRLTQSQLQRGAKPYDIIPCPRRRSEPAYTSPPSSPSPSYSGQRKWAAVAAGISNGLLGIGAKVSAGLGKDYATRAEAERAAVRSCEKNISSCSVVTAWNTGCYYITVSKNADNVAWGSGRTAQEAYDNCYARVQGGNCDTKTLGVCYP